MAAEPDPGPGPQQGDPLTEDRANYCDEEQTAGTRDPFGDLPEACDEDEEGTERPENSGSERPCVIQIKAEPFEPDDDEDDEDPVPSKRSKRKRNAASYNYSDGDDDHHQVSDLKVPKIEKGGDEESGSSFQQTWVIEREDGRFVCRVCDSSTSSSKGYIKHVMFKQSCREAIGEEALDELKAIYCKNPNQTKREPVDDESNGSWEEEEEDGDEEGPNSCKSCQMSFRSLNGLGKHIALGDGPCRNAYTDDEFEQIRLASDRSLGGLGTEDCKRMLSACTDLFEMPSFADGEGRFVCAACGDALGSSLDLVDHIKGSKDCLRGVGKEEFGKMKKELADIRAKRSEALKEHVMKEKRRAYYRKNIEEKRQKQRDYYTKVILKSSFSYNVAAVLH